MFERGLGEAQRTYQYLGRTHQTHEIVGLCDSNRFFNGHRGLPIAPRMTAIMTTAGILCPEAVAKYDWICIMLDQLGSERPASQGG